MYRSSLHLHFASVSSCPCIPSINPRVSLLHAACDGGWGGGQPQRKPRSLDGSMTAVTHGTGRRPTSFQRVAGAALRRPSLPLSPAPSVHHCTAARGVVITIVTGSQTRLTPVSTWGGLIWGRGGSPFGRRSGRLRSDPQPHGLAGGPSRLGRGPRPHVCSVVSPAVVVVGPAAEARWLPMQQLHGRTDRWPGRARG